MTDAELTSLANRAQAVNYVLLAALGIFGLTLIGEVLELVGVIDLMAYDIGPLEALYGVLLIVHTVIFIVSVIVVCMWIYRAHALSLVSSICMIVSAYLLREIVLQVTAAQRTGLVPTQVFE